MLDRGMEEVVDGSLAGWKDSLSDWNSTTLQGPGPPVREARVAGAAKAVERREASIIAVVKKFIMNSEIE